MQFVSCLTSHWYNSKQWFLRSAVAVFRLYWKPESKSGGMSFRRHILTRTKASVYSLLIDCSLFDSGWYHLSTVPTMDKCKIRRIRCLVWTYFIVIYYNGTGYKFYKLCSSLPRSRFSIEIHNVSCNILFFSLQSFRQAILL